MRCFCTKGPYENFGLVYDTIFREWLPSSGCTLCNSPCMEKYISNPERVVPEKLKTEMYIPIE